MKTSALSAFTTAAVFAFAMPLVAQSSATTTAQKSADRYDTSKEVSLTGCVEKNKSGGYFLTDASMAANDSMARSGSSTTGTSGTTGATSSTTTSSATTTAPNAASNSTWNLENGDDLDKYVGQKVQVTGHPEKSMSGDEVKGTTGPEVKARDFDVKSVKMIASSCK